MRIHPICLLLACLAIAVNGCSSDPAGPVVEQFIEDGTYGVDAGDTYRYVGEVTARTVSFPRGVGTGALLQIGEIKEITFEAVLLHFDFSEATAHAGKTVERSILDLPVRSVQDTLFTLDVTFNELLEDFEETDTLTSIDDIACRPDPIPDSLGATTRTLDIESGLFSLSSATVQAWIDAAEPAGFAILWAAPPPEPGLIEINAREYGTDPVTLRVEFTDGSADTFAVDKDYPIAAFDSGAGFDCVGGVATRIHFEFALDGIPDSAMIHRSNLVLTVRGEDGMGSTSGEAVILLLNTDFVYNLYAPGIPGRLDTLRTQVDVGYFDPTVTETKRLPLRGLIPDIFFGARENAGVVFQSELEGIRVQRASFYTNEADSLLRPYIEVFYSLPAEFTGDQ
jgi:hypothetical protein